ncbi:hypothetical protein BCR37DRAFT_376732 [Protomyces lactucae-debilis]|uniref:Uncharacterized protein n=1 Tax=Protomyces lactucae-debilis TaxID=2754530 RepID=A0A1Y2FQC9_PROLT|nr:uncharacterized protein BCR37DRAFT_376732 [Protomyces lactucae-debilis]ORY86188.1 hypothetical protein BCR37DRAFT_376732 [Protomyces lactucae-debilis]
MASHDIADVPTLHIAGYELDRSLALSIILVLVLAALQLAWPTVKLYFEQRGRGTAVPVREMPIIETISEDPKPEPVRRPFKKPKADISSWIGSEKGVTSSAALQDPNSIPSAGAEALAQSIKVTEDGQVIDVDGKAVEEGTIVYIRQQMVDRVLNTGGTSEMDENEDAMMKLDIIKSIKALSDAEVVEWFQQNKELLNYSD